MGREGVVRKGWGSTYTKNLVENFPNYNLENTIYA